jgi:hypothetical protein
VTLDHEDVEAIARRLAELVGPGPPERMLDARELADRLGVQRGWVYSHSAMLGGVRLGNGPRAPLRFDLERARAAARRVPGTDGRPSAEAPRPPRRRLAAGVTLIEGRSGR